MNKSDPKKPVLPRAEQQIEDGWPNTIRTRDELDAALEAGMAGGFSERGFEEQVEDGWPNTIRTRDELDAALEAGSRSGRSPHTIPEIAERVLRKIENG